MKLLCWNVNGRTGDAAHRQLDAVLGRSPDVIALQEVKRQSFGIWTAGLRDAGYSVISTADLAEFPHPGTVDPLPEGVKQLGPKSRRIYFNLTAARDPIAALPGLSFDDPEQRRLAFPEKYLAVRVRKDGLDIDVHNAHVPDAATVGAIKVHAFEAIRRRVDDEATGPRVLCGDFNCQLPEEDYGPGVKPKPQDPLKVRWAKAEASVVENPDLPDAYCAYRQAHGIQGPFPASHFTGRTPRRYDHIFASRHLDVRGCEYLSEWLEARWSDHAPVEAELALVHRATGSRPA